MQLPLSEREILELQHRLRTLYVTLSHTTSTYGHLQQALLAASKAIEDTRYSIHLLEQDIQDLCTHAWEPAARSTHRYCPKCKRLERSP